MTTIKGTTSKKGNAIVSDHVKDRGNDPCFIKKAEEAKEILRKVGIPGTKKLHFK